MRPLTVNLLVCLAFTAFVQIAHAAVVTVCQADCDHASIQAAVDAASDGDLIQLAPGEFKSFTTDKKLTIEATEHPRSNVRSNATTLKGSNVVTEGGDVTFRRLRLIGHKPVVADGGRVEVDSCFFDRNESDGVSFEKNGRGIVRHSVFDGSGDDNIDIDHQTRDVVIENNELLHAGNDAIEVRQHMDAIPTRVSLIIRGNRIEGSQEDGLQLMDYDGFSNRLYRVEGNLFKSVGAAAIGVRVGASTSASPGAPVAQMPEPLYLVNNTFVDNPEAVSGGGNIVAINNVFVRNGIALRFVSTDSVLRHNLLYQNANDAAGSNSGIATIARAPLLDDNFEIRPGSPGEGAGVARLSHSYLDMDGSPVVDTVIALARPPDLGWNGIGGSIESHSPRPSSPGSSTTELQKGRSGSQGQPLSRRRMRASIAPRSATAGKPRRSRAAQAPVRSGGRFRRNPCVHTPQGA